MAALAPATLFILPSTGRSYENASLESSVPIAATAVASRSQTALADSQPRSDLRAYIFTGFRTVFAGGVILTIIRVVYVGSQSTPLSLASVGPAFPLVRIAGTLILTVDESH